MLLGHNDAFSMARACEMPSPWGQVRSCAENATVMPIFLYFAVNFLVELYVVKICLLLMS
jgi:hypothetical protein